MKGSIRSRGKNTWQIVLDIGKDADGNRQQRYVTVHGPKGQAQARLAALKHEIDTGMFVEASKLTVGDYLLKKWLPHTNPRVAAKTYQEYEGKIRVYVVPHLGSMNLEALRPLHIQEFYALMLKDGRARGSGGLAPQTVVHLHRILHKALEQAVKWQLLARNPADSVEPPKAARHDMCVLLPEQVETLVAQAAGTLLEMPTLLAVTTGLRRGEILALRWSDVDTAEGLLSVRRSLEETRGGLAFKEPKTGSARRVVVIPEGVLVALAVHKGRQDAQKVLLGPEYCDQDLICAAEDGNPLSPRWVTNSFAALVSRTALPHVRFHDLRHTHATLLLQAKIHPKVVSERLGHSTISITMDTYSHVLPSMQQEAARRINEVLRDSLPSPVSDLGQPLDEPSKDR